VPPNAGVSLGSSRPRHTGLDGGRAIRRGLPSGSRASELRSSRSAWPSCSRAAASASLAGEQQQGQNLIAQLQTGTKTCRNLTADDLDHIGEYLMFRALGSTSLHRAMNDRMIAMLGEQGESRMHQIGIDFG
jgi:hypothetical protein